MNRSNWHCFINPMFFQNGLNFSAVILNIQSLLFKFIIIDDGNLSEKVIISKRHQFPSEIKSNSLKKSLSCKFIHPIKFQKERHESQHRECIFDSPWLPFSEEEIKFKRKEFYMFCIIVNSITVSLQSLSITRFKIFRVHFTNTCEIIVTIL